MALDFASVERGPEVRLVEAVISNDVPDPDRLALYASVINERAFRRDTALTTAARLGRETWCKTLLNAGADPFLDDGVGSTPFFIAVLSGQTSILHALVEAGIDPLKQIDHALPALWWAIYYERESVVAFLLEQGVSPWDTDRDNRDAYNFALNHGLIGIAELIAKARAQSTEQEEK